MSEPSPTHAPGAPEALDPNFRIALPNFEGPLDLLLHLIRKHELDILDLPIAFITDKYLEYLGLMEELNLDIASEYLVMAATLAYIKSKTLLPRSPEEAEDEALEEVDPRAELIRRLLEYQKYKTVAEDLASRPIAGRDVFERGTSAPTATGPAPLAQVSVFKLLDALKKVAQRANAKFSLEVDAERITIQERMGEIVDLLKARRRCSFEELFENVGSSYDIVVTFLALLEMAKMRMASLYQTAHEEPIYLEYALLDESGQPLDPEELKDADASYAYDSDGASEDAPEEAVEDETGEARRVPESMVVPALSSHPQEPDAEEP